MSFGMKKAGIQALRNVLDWEDIWGKPFKSRASIYEQLRYEGYLRRTEEYHGGQKCAGYRITDLGRSELQQSKEVLACLR